MHVKWYWKIPLSCATYLLQHVTSVSIENRSFTVIYLFWAGAAFFIFFLSLLSAYWLFRTKKTHLYEKTRTAFITGILLKNFQVFPYCWRRVRKDQAASWKKVMLNHTIQEKTIASFRKKVRGRDANVKRTQASFTPVRDLGSLL